MSFSTSNADDDATEEFRYEVPITNLKLESNNVVDIFYVMKEEIAEIEDLDSESTTIVSDKNDSEYVTNHVKTIISENTKKTRVMKEPNCAKVLNNTKSGCVINLDDVTNNNKDDFGSPVIDVDANKTDIDQQETEDLVILEDTEGSENYVIDVSAKKTDKAQKQTENPIDLDGTDESEIPVIDVDAKEIDEDRTETENPINLKNTEETENPVIDVDAKKTDEDENETEKSIDIDKTERPQIPVIDVEAKKTDVNHNVEKSLDIDNSAGSENLVIDDNANNTDNGRNENKNPIDLDDSEGSKNPVSVYAKSTEKSIDLNVLYDIKKSKNHVIKVAKITKINNQKEKEKPIDLDEIDGTDLSCNITNSDIIVLDENKTDSDVIILNGNKTDSDITVILDGEGKQLSNPIVIDEVMDNDCSIIEASISTAKNLNKHNEYNTIYKENKLMSELIEKCLDMENTEGMSRVINRTLLGIYKDVDEEYKKTSAFRKVLIKTIMQLDTEPQRKFSHLKNLCDELKTHRVRKRVTFHTLEKERDKGKESTISSTVPTKKRRLNAIIDLDHVNENDKAQVNVQTVNRQPKEYPPIEIDDSSETDNDVILLDNMENLLKTKANKRRRPKKYSSNSKERKVAKKIKSAVEHCRLNSEIDQIPLPSNTTNQFDEMNIDQVNRTPSIRCADVGALLEPIREEIIFNPEMNQQKIIHIEKRIALLKKQIDQAEECEVTKDNCSSPYIICERYKESIVKLYKELCQLTGTEATKRHEVRLQVVSGHPEGPVRCLEEFLNDNIDEYGNPPFPDLQDVHQCVCIADERYNMNWSSVQIMNEAQALFSQYGRSMQKRRQKREFKDLMSLVKEEAPDPADEDPVLQARLMENSLIAKKNEHDLLERFAKMEHTDLQLRLIYQSEESDDGSEVNPPKDAVDPPNTKETSTQDKALIASASIPTPSVSSSDNNVTNGSLGIMNTTVRSTISVSAGNIVIQPIVTHGETQNHRLQGNITQNSDTEISLFSSEFKNFIVNSKEARQKCSLVYNRLVRHNSKKAVHKIQTVSPNITEIGKESSDRIVLSKPFSQTSENDISNAANLAKEILSLIQTDVCTEKEKYNLQKTDQRAFDRFNPTVKLTNLNLKSVPTNVYHTKSAKESEQSVNPQTDGFEIFTHTVKLKTTHGNKDLDDNNKLNTSFNQIILDKEKHSDSKESTNETSQTKNVDSNTDVNDKVKPESKESTDETSQTKNVDSNIDDVSDIVKPEPLDIPSMLEDLGQGYTTTIFDIEDPFLVIEISDSSESEDEDI